MPHTGQQSPDLAVPPFGEHNLQDGRLPVPFLYPHALHAGEALGEVLAAAKPSQGCGRDVAGHGHLIRLGHPMPRMGQAVGQLPIIRDEDQPLAGGIQPANAIDAASGRRDKIDDPRPTSRISRCRHNAGWLMDGVAQRLGLRESFTVNADLLHMGVHPRSQGRDTATINFHAAFQDERLAGPPAGDPEGRENFL
jgi:hypothetical protein